MSWKIWLDDDESLLCSLGSGEITAKEVIESAKTLPDFRPGLDRLTIFDHSAKFSSLNFDELMKVNDFVRSIETPGGKNISSRPTVNIKVAYVCPDEMGILILDLFNNLWDKESGEQVDYDIFSTIEDALFWLERPNTKVSLPALV